MVFQKCNRKETISIRDPILCIDISFGKTLLETVKMLLDTLYRNYVYLCKSGN